LIDVPRLHNTIEERMTAGGRTRDRLGRIPAEVTTLVGRKRDTAEVRRLLSEARLVTLTGIGGSGKSRLAVRVATELRRAFADGVWLVDLVSVTDPARLTYAVSEALGLASRDDEAVTEFLRDRNLLLVLDNVEHLLDACAAFVDRALRTGPGVHVLCTSRQVLGIPAEYVWDVLPLAVPEPVVAYTAGIAARYPAVALFVERAGAVHPAFLLDADNWPTVAEICRQLDGLPLGIELAAAQTRTHSLDQLATGLFRTLEVRHAVPARHRRLDSAFDWSFALCSPGEQLLWQRMSVFAGTFELDAAEYVAGEVDAPSGAGPAEPVPGALDLVAGLVEKSVLCREEPAVGPPRYRLLETVRRYGVDRLRATYGPAEERRLRERHRDWYLDLAERLDADWFGPRQREWVRLLHDESGNFRLALNGATGTVRLRLAAALQYSWYAGAAWGEGRYWLERALPDGTGDLAHLRALLAYAMIAMLQGDRAIARTASEDAVALADALGDPVWCARAAGTLGTALMLGGDLPGAVRVLEPAEAALSGRPATDQLDVLASSSLGVALSYAGDPERATRHVARGVAACRAAGDLWALAYALVGATQPAIQAGRFDAAAGYLEESLRIRRDLDDLVGIAGSLERMAWLAADQGDHDRAARLLGASRHGWALLGQPLYGAARWLHGRDECARRCRAASGETRFTALLTAGEQLATAEAVRYALGEPEPAAGGTGPEPLTLTPRERQVAELIAAGLSNQQIATRLTTSPRTTDSHVQNILRKLGFTSRAQVAAWVAGQPWVARQP
jgi:predicted ATPase/DNA-binding CsgD family transcriptional regulator